MVSGGFDEFSLAHTTSPGKGVARPPSNPHTGIDNVRTQYASPIPRSDAPNIVAANGKVTRLLCGDGCRLAAATAEIGFGLDTGQDPDWRMMSSRPAAADRDGARSAESYSMLKGGEPFPGGAREAAP
jgi:hypothetical protein